MLQNCCVLCRFQGNNTSNSPVFSDTFIEWTQFQDGRCTEHYRFQNTKQEDTLLKGPKLNHNNKMISTKTHQTIRDKRTY